ncbi:NAD(P)/FAD-dependent oxidoreductase [Pseudomonas fluorescens]|uniref:NAD(P)/FAD-dependent oxidoreductase n=1 Tax=Pseudomonas fluorescens TaxID=294 RepID=UPI001784AC2D|nr:NAD(P)/FAD-dependent oxidoreductase [Pseudomonas fluorescens]MBD8099671.1 NAD(P)/FAD-dependent oxidoreductase [Pseudomonas fluorescens]MBD8776609.1 NAD(P)/FAD-dependent oxidoreductase [Pseudomonas fluorescens]MBD8781052.1 NAD(P)/FAD-dependent oxidoreductase [Pseudomonas fluorescens]MBD8798297.1 NAD(P)/FAD-dependent oxidoreductase [Pseudomonas fluorescens]
MVHDVIIVGGSYAGLSAGLQLARARRTVLVIDAGQRRNRFAATSHGFLGQDGQAPEAIAAEGRSQLMEYPSVTWVQDFVRVASAQPHGFSVHTECSGEFKAKRLILATGVVDELPAIEGLAERWGTRVFHCPYCHGYELDQGRIGVLATSALAMHHALMLPDWGATTLFTDGVFTPDAEQQAQLQRRGVSVESGRVRCIQGERADLQLHDGRVFALDGIFTMSRTRISALAQQLGCELAEGPTGPYLHTNETRQTSVAGVFACGDTSLAAGSVALAVAEGVRAGVGAHFSLISQG